MTGVQTWAFPISKVTQADHAGRAAVDQPEQHRTAAGGGIAARQVVEFILEALEIEAEIQRFGIGLEQQPGDAEVGGGFGGADGNERGGGLVGIFGHALSDRKAAQRQSERTKKKGDRKSTRLNSSH